MSELTPTNEEHLAELVSELKSGEKVRLMPSHKQRLSVIEVLRLRIEGSTHIDQRHCCMCGRFLSTREPLRCNRCDELFRIVDLEQDYEPG